jgi:hypothetical protein
VTAEHLDLDTMADTLAEWLATGPDVTEEDRRGAREALDAMGVPALLEALDMAERIIRFGNSFHSIAGFFADGSGEQDYVRRLTDLAGERRVASTTANT